MTRIESEKTTVNNSQEKIYSFLSNFNNFKKLMPPQVANWQSTEDECSFTISGMATLGMKIVEKKPFSEIKIITAGKVPFNFTLQVFIERIDDNKSLCQLVFEADLNPALKMMLQKPLTNFFNMLVTKLKDVQTDQLN